MGSGFVGGLLAWALAQLVQWRMDTSFDELSLIPVLAASLMTNLFGIWLYSLLRRKIPAPRLTFAFLAVLAAVAYTLILGAREPHPLFLEAAVSAHFMIAFTAIYLIPALSGRSKI